MPWKLQSGFCQKIEVSKNTNWPQNVLTENLSSEQVLASTHKEAVHYGCGIQCSANGTQV